MFCNICGKQIPSYHVGDFFPDSQCLFYGNHPNEIVNHYPVVNPLCCQGPLKNDCEHCYCQRETVYQGKPVEHKKCCQCGDRKVL